jgi:hypothetical protein
MRQGSANHALAVQLHDFCGFSSLGLEVHDHAVHASVNTQELEAKIFRKGR